VTVQQDGLGRKRYQLIGLSDRERLEGLPMTHLVVKFQQLYKLVVQLPIENYDMKSFKS
jgi:hypothetical protein